MTAYVNVFLPLPLPAPYTYRVPDGMVVVPGSLVEVPLRRRQEIGIVWPGEPSYPERGSLKEVSRALTMPPLPLELLNFITWVAHYTLSPIGAVLKMTLSTELQEEESQQIIYNLGSQVKLSEGRMTHQRQRLLQVMEDYEGLTRQALLSKAEVSASVLDGLVAQGLVVREEVSVEENLLPPDPRYRKPALTEEQETAAQALQSSFGTFSAIVLDGVTGAGKTEVYFEAIAEALRRGGQSLVLLPEIALSAQWHLRFAERFGVQPAVWHSSVSGAQRRKTWRQVLIGATKVVVGARSALFLPFQDLQLIVVDEEHDASFKQEEGVMYNARDMAVVRAKQKGIPIVLSSATPSLETVVNAENGRYHHLRLSARYGPAQLPRIDLVDLRQHKLPSGQWLSQPLRHALTETLERDEQAMIFLNRRGYAPLTLCRTCGFRFECKACSAWLVEHRGRVPLLQCHHCGYHEPKPHLCPACGEEGAFVACGPGVERVAEEIAALFPDVSQVVMSSDTIQDSESLRAALADIHRGKIKLVIGTQLMAKGHDFPGLTLVGVVDADLGLTGGDLRASERTFQLLQQVAGRAGRHQKPGQVLLQTYYPEHPLMQALQRGERDSFIEEEKEARQSSGLPPFGKLAGIILSGEESSSVERVARQFVQKAPVQEGVRVLGPAPAPLYKVRGRFRWRLLIKATKETHIQNYLHGWLDKIKLPSGVRMQIDIDPLSFF